MLNLLLFGIVGLIIVFPLIMSIWKKPDFFFWLFLNLFFDPGGYITGFLGGNILGRLNISDIIIAFIVVCLMSSKVNWGVITKDKFLKKFLRFFLIYAIYYFVVYGGIIPFLNNDLDYATFLLKSRYFFYGIIILISVYVFSLRSLKYFYSITLFIGAICLSLYWITLITGINITPVFMMERYRGSGMMRIGMLSYGIFDLIFPLALIAYLMSRKKRFPLKYKKWLFYCGILMVSTMLITLSRREIISIIGIILSVVFLISYLSYKGKLANIAKMALPTLVVVFVLQFTLPKYIGYVSKIGEDTFSLLITGKDTRGIGSYRISGTGDLLLTKDYINKNIWFGTGYSYIYWGETGYATSPRGDIYARAADAAGEVPIYYVFFGYGIVGVVIMIPLYFIIAKLFLRISRLLRKNFTIYLKYPYVILFSIYIQLIIVGKFTYKIFNLGSDFHASNLCGTALYLGIGFALYFKLNREKNIIMNLILSDKLSININNNKA